MTKVIAAAIIVCIGLFLWQAYVQYKIDKGDFSFNRRMAWITYCISVISVIIPLLVSLYDPMSLPNLKFEYNYNGVEHREDLYQIFPYYVTIDNFGSFYYPANRFIGLRMDHRFLNGHYNTIYDTSLGASIHILIMDGEKLLGSIPVEAQDDFFISKNYDNSTGELILVHSPKIQGTMQELLKELFEKDGCPYEVDESIILRFYYKQSVDDEAYVLSKEIGGALTKSITEEEINSKEISGIKFTRDMYDDYINNLKIDGDYVTSFYDPIEEHIDVIYDAVGFVK